jgi:hypothetical protein
MGSKPFIQVVVVTAGVMLATTCLAKVWAAVGDARMLGVVDPILGMPWKQLLAGVGVLEIIVATICFFGRSQQLGLSLLPWRSGSSPSSASSLTGCAARSMHDRANGCVLGFLGVMFVLLFPIRSCVASDLNFEVEGYVSFDYPAFNINRVSRFKVRVQSTQWHLWLEPTEWKIGSTSGRTPPVPLAYELSSDSTNVFELRAYKQEDFPKGTPARIAEKWHGNLPEGRPSYHEVYSLWYAFASATALTNSSDGSLPTLHPGRSWVYGTFEKDQRYPGVPSRVLATNLESTHAWDYHVRSLTNAGPFWVPASFAVSYSRTVTPTNFGLLTAQVTSLVTKTSREDYKLSLNKQQTLIYDTRGNSVVRLQSNDWAPSNAFNHLHEKFGDPNMRSTRKTPVALWIIFAAAPLSLLLIFYYAYQNTK